MELARPMKPPFLRTSNIDHVRKGDNREVHHFIPSLHLMDHQGRFFTVLHLKGPVSGMIQQIYRRYEVQRGYEMMDLPVIAFTNMVNVTSPQEGGSHWSSQFHMDGVGSASGPNVNFLGIQKVENSHNTSLFL